jgi:hypothetical protein
MPLTPENLGVFLLLDLAGHIMGHSDFLLRLLFAGRQAVKKPLNRCYPVSG